MELQPASGGSPTVTFQEFPVEIINIIFVYTLPNDALDHEQPNIRISPMLLCYVCSQWRSIALRLPALWAHLYYSVPAPQSKEQESGSIQTSAHEFLEWWSCNLGPNYPFRFRLYTMEAKRQYVQDRIYINLFNLAWHLEIENRIAWLIIQDIRRGESSMLTFANLESLRIRNKAKHYFHVSRIFPLRPEHPICKLRLNGFILEPEDVFQRPPILWSSLTHLTFDSVYLSTDTWFDLIHACVNLQFCSFDFRIAFEEDPSLVNPQQFTHLQLRELVIKLPYDSRNIAHHLLKNTSFPSLTAFRVSARLTTEDIQCILKSIPSFLNLYWIAGNSIWFRAYGDDEHFLKLHTRTAPHHPDRHPDKFLCLYKEAHDRIFRQSPRFVKLVASGRSDTAFP
ncbi:hypothetical protein M413DRAFT_443392 [Hebeloma cylindrosporum]|uniref:F-box domain-containing protein n=1 Tax=Hebeloma cylindrosporum TaxID=76867 RepID=A0A0C3C3G2_HEBCY|nr:hypothetical protein M413DRAFT_443392 [Hebeloma cylindrosporum h7]